jgi:hypothetical protein
MLVAVCKYALHNEKVDYRAKCCPDAEVHEGIPSFSKQEDPS